MSEISNAPDFFVEQTALYQAALARWEAIRVEWVELGSPNLAAGSMGQPIEHPLVKMMREHEIVVTRLAAPLVKRHRGPAPAVFLGGVEKAGSAKLRLARAAKTG